MLTQLGLSIQSGLRLKALSLLLILLLFGTAACRRNQATEPLESDVADSPVDSNLTFNNITLEQANEQGETVWKVKADQATYSPDRRLARVTNPDGELFQDGEPVFRVQAERGDIRQDGQKIFLRGKIVATDIRSGAILRGDELEWLPQEDVLLVRDNLTGTHPQVTVSAQEGRVLSREQRMELSGQVVANAQDPRLRLRSEEVVWEMEEQRVVSDRPVQIHRLAGNQVTDRARGETGEINLETQVATLQQNAQLALQDPPLQISSDALIWNLANETVVSNEPINIVHRERQVRFAANQGRMDLQRNLFYLITNVRAVGQRDRSRLTSDRLTWNVETQQVIAEGNVNYRQSEPAVTLRGQRAVGRLEEETIVVSGGDSGNRVVTEIIPE